VFTIKHILFVTPRDDEGVASGPSYKIENLYEASNVVFCDSPDDMGALQLRDGDTFIAGLFGGVAYVMNDHGKTVARYDLPEAHCGASAAEARK
jgi:hypothetical protein